ncbi:MAG: arginine repressor [Ruminococcaceae bacterium]|nr:arginine repressor [Oscillospiraceae bacterium]
MSKFDRQERILNLIKYNNISTQTDLTERLIKSGYNVTQATVSRDLQELRIVKGVGEDGVYKYELPKEDVRVNTSRHEAVLRQCLVSVDYAMNTVVLKTMTGAAQAVAYALDMYVIEDVLGTIAGDDTIMMVVRTENTARNVCTDLKRFLV